MDSALEYKSLVQVQVLVMVVVVGVGTVGVACMDSLVDVVEVVVGLGMVNQ